MEVLQKILVIDDEPTLRENILEVLSIENYSVAEAENGKIGLQRVQAEPPDLILCDVTMPILDGYGFLQALRQDPVTAAIPLVFLTANSEKQDLRQGMNLGADDYLTKPFTPQELLTAIRTRLDKQAFLQYESQCKLDRLRDSITFALPTELVTPLNVILNHSENLMSTSGSVSSSELFDIASDMFRSGQELNHLILNFLVYAELELASRDPHFVRPEIDASYDCRKVIISTAVQQSSQKHRNADLQGEVESASISMPPNELQKIVEELIDNALKFSPEGTPVIVEGSVKSSGYELRVIDQGRGMTLGQVANLGAYTQFDRKLFRQQGSGLGLVITKRLVELYDGQFSLETQLDQGTTVTVRLPLFS